MMRRSKLWFSHKRYIVYHSFGQPSGCPNLYTEIPGRERSGIVLFIFVESLQRKNLLFG